MKPQTKELNKIKIAFAKMGAGSKTKAVKETGISASEISYLLNGGTLKDEKYFALKSFLNLN